MTQAANTLLQQLMRVRTETYDAVAENSVWIIRQANEDLRAQSQRIREAVSAAQRSYESLPVSHISSDLEHAANLIDSAATACMQLETQLRQAAENANVLYQQPLDQQASLHVDHATFREHDEYAISPARTALSQIMQDTRQARARLSMVSPIVRSAQSDAVNGGADEDWETYRRCGIILSKIQSVSDMTAVFEQIETTISGLLHDLHVAIEALGPEIYEGFIVPDAPQLEPVDQIAPPLGSTHEPTSQIDH